MSEKSQTEQDQANQELLDFLREAGKMEIENLHQRRNHLSGVYYSLSTLIISGLFGYLINMDASAGLFVFAITALGVTLLFNLAALKIEMGFASKEAEDKLAFIWSIARRDKEDFDSVVAEAIAREKRNGRITRVLDWVAFGLLTMSLILTLLPALVCTV
ncbi:MAG: hypothetical protein RIE86_09625 [Imperialibacter sp.]|uniref:hypothetical protein n=1 Tax=Imperialibacter sp. TaxID=2038411 RepID=UPI0032EAF682